MKKLIRRLVLSRAYQLGGQHDDANFKADPDNALVWRMTPRRLEAEALLTADQDREIGKGKVPTAKLLASPWTFRRHGQSGLWVSELFPEVARHTDDLCVVNSMQTDLPNHTQAFLQMHTGNFQSPRPSLGRGCCTAWGPKTTTSPASSPSVRRSAAAGRPTTAARSCRPFIRGRGSAPPASSAPPPSAT